MTSISKTLQAIFHTLRPDIHFAKEVMLAFLLTCCLNTSNSYANEQDWWFDVEVIVFERNLSPSSIAEQFEQSTLTPPLEAHQDLLTSYIQPDLSYLLAGLPYCRASKRLQVAEQYAQGYAFPEPIAEAPSAITDEDEIPIAESTAQVAQDETARDNFQYQVATDDIFADTEQTAINAESNELNADLQNNEAQPADEQTVLKPRLPIQVEFIEWQVPEIFPCAYAEQIDPMLRLQESNESPKDEISLLAKQTPVKIEGIEWQQPRGAFLLPSSINRMNDLYDAINKQRDISPLLHLNWRQPVKFGRDKAQTFRLFAGKNYAEDFIANGELMVEDTDKLFANLSEQVDLPYIPEQELAKLTPEEKQARLLDLGKDISSDNPPDLFTQIEQALADDSPIQLLNDQTSETTEQQAQRLNNIWQLDGLITVYLRNVGRVPYLHIDSNLDYRYPVFISDKTQNLDNDYKETEAQPMIAGNQISQANYLQSANFNQLRRVISKQVHYFDHPLFGMIVRINRYEWPEVDEDEAPQ